MRGVYRNRTLEESAPLETSAPLDAATAGSATNYNRDTYTYDREPDLYNVSDRDNNSIKLYQERLIANKQRQKTGEVSIGKHVETETARVAAIRFG